MLFIRKLLRALMRVTTALGLSLLGAPAEVVSAAADAVGDLLTDTSSEQPPMTRPLDPIAREARVTVLLEFNASTLLAWQAAGILMTYRLRLVGYVQGLMLMARAQRQFEVQMALAATSISSILLLGQPETQRAALQALGTLGHELSLLAKCRQGSPEASHAHEEGTERLAPVLATWREAARDDLEEPS